MYFHRANKVKPGQEICIEGIRKTTEILECTICNSQVHLTITSNLINLKEQQTEKDTNLLNRSPISKTLPSNQIPLTKYKNKEANRLLIEVAKDRKLLVDIYKDTQSTVGLYLEYTFIYIILYLFDKVLMVWTKQKLKLIKRYQLLNLN